MKHKFNKRHNNNAYCATSFFIVTRLDDPTIVCYEELGGIVRLAESTCLVMREDNTSAMQQTTLTFFFFHPPTKEQT